MGFQFQALSSPEDQHHLPGVDSSNALFLHNKFSLFRSFSSLTGSLILAIKRMLMKKMLCSSLDCLSPLVWFITHSRTQHEHLSPKRRGISPLACCFLENREACPPLCFQQVAPEAAGRPHLVSSGPVF